MFRILRHQHDAHRENVRHQQQLEAQQNVVAQVVSRIGRQVVPARNEQRDNGAEDQRAIQRGRPVDERFARIPPAELR